MHTPEGTLERGHHTAPPYAKPATNPYQEDPAVDEEVLVLPHLMSLPNGDDNYADSYFLEKELGNLHIGQSHADTAIPINYSGATSNDSSPNMPQPPYNLKQGWMDGILGCLRPMFSLIGKGNEIKEHGDQWEIPFEALTIIQYLGSGGQGMVSLGKLHNEFVAVKKVSLEKDTDIKHLRKLDHKNIIKFIGVCTKNPCYAIVMEYCAYGSLYDLMKREDQVITPQGVVRWAKEIAQGMSYVHSHKIIHRDLKSLNILIGKGEVIKISDFGTSRVWDERSMQMSFNGTVAWMAPEALREVPCSEKVDIWSYGIVIWELLTREPPFKDLEHSSIIFLVGSGKLKPLIPKTCPDGFKLIMEMCWKYNPKERPSFKLILNHLEIASMEILNTYKNEQFYKTQEIWKEEIKTHMTVIKEEHQKTKIELEYSKEQWRRQREREMQHIAEMKIHLKSKMNDVEILRETLVDMIDKIEKRKPTRPQHSRNRLIRPFMKKLERRRGSQNSTTPTSPDCTSPDSPQIVPPTKCPLYAHLNASSRPESTTMSTQTSVKSRKRHHRSYSGSSRSPGCSRSSSSRTTVVDTETQTDHHMDVSETDLSPSSFFPATTFLDRTTTQPQRVILQEVQDGSDSEAANGNSVRLHYMVPHSEQEVQVFQRMDSRSPSPVLGLDQVDTLNCNAQPTQDYSDEDNLKRISEKVTALIKGTNNGNLFPDMSRSSDNGNISDDPNVILREQRYSDTRQRVDSTEDCHNDSYTDEEGEVIQSYPSLRRKSILRRPIPRSRRPIRSKTQQQRRETNISDEGNTSEYSVSPSSKSSTLESNPDRIPRALPNLPAKRPNQSDGSSESESEENTTIATQLCYNMQEMNKNTESVV